jgi:dTDP-4-dehydrorhamnose reductase
MRVLILGGTRYFGKNTFERLMKNAHLTCVKTLSRSKQNRDTKSHIICDRKNRNELFSVFNSFQPDVIVDMVNFSIDDSNGLIEAYSKNLLTSLKHYIMVSSFFVYNHFDLREYREKQLDFSLIKMKKIDNYTYQKIEAESALYKSKLMNLTSILRLPFIFSSDDYSGRFQLMCEISKRGNIKSNSGNYRYSMISKSLASKGIEYLCNTSPQGIIDFANSGCVSTEEMVQIIRNSLGFFGKFNNLDLQQSPYEVEKDICIQNFKIKINQSLDSDLKEEARLYFSSSKS